MTAWPLNPIGAILLTSLVAAAALALVRDYRWSARINILASLLVLIFAALLVWRRPPADALLLADDLNVVFILLNALVGFTTSVFSASYIGHELDTGRLSPATLRFYHAMFQLMMFGMDLALLANNTGLMWVAVELATLATVMMVGLYRTHAGAGGRLEILHPRQRRHRPGAVRHDPRLPGRRPRARRGPACHGLDRIDAARFAPSTRPCSMSRSSSCCSATAPKWGWFPCTPGCRTPMPRVPRPVSAVLSGLLLNVALYAVLRFKMIMAGKPRNDRRRAADDAARPRLADLRRDHAVPPPGHQTPLRLLIHRAYGDHHLRLRAGRAAGKFRRAAADGDAQASPNRRSSSPWAISRRSKALRNSPSCGD